MVYNRPMENWKEIEGFEGVYEVSDQGRVRRLPGLRYGGRGRMARHAGGIVKGAIDKSTGYHIVALGRDGGRRYVHRLVCQAFNGAAPEGKNQVAHYDGDKTNNRPSNLRWADWKDNRKDGKRLGEIKSGAAHHCAILTIEQVEDIRARHAGGEGMRSIGRHYGICHQHVGDIIRRKIWK